MATDRRAAEAVRLLVFSAAAAASPSRKQGPIPNSADFVIALRASLILTRAQAAGRQARLPSGTASRLMRQEKRARSRAVGTSCGQHLEQGTDEGDPAGADCKLTLYT